MDEVHIILRGNHGSGKTIIAERLRNFLLSEGYELTSITDRVNKTVVNQMFEELPAEYFTVINPTK